MSYLTQSMGYAQKNGNVVLTMSVADYQLVLMILGFCTAAAMRGEGPLSPVDLVRLTNRLNEGNPGFTPYSEVVSAKAG